MIQVISFGVIFVVLFISFVWIFIFFFNEKKHNKFKLKATPKITIAIPVFNEEKAIIETLDSINELSYPLKQIEVIVVDDGSTDNTKKEIHNFIEANPKLKIIYIYQKNAGKATALNNALKVSTGEFFSVIDADSTVSKSSLRNIMALFQNSKEDVASIISSMKISNTKYFLPKVQEVEYVVTILLRQLMSDINVLHTTHGVLCVTKTNILKKIGGFDTDNITEDFELAMRLRSKGYDVLACKKSIVFTKAPKTLKSFWNQRVRWFRGFIATHRKYKKMIGNKGYKRLGLFQLPLNLVSPLIFLIMSFLIAYNLIKILYLFIFRMVFVEGYLAVLFGTLPNFKQVVLTSNLNIIIPGASTIIIGVLLVSLAFSFIGEKIKPMPIFIYLFIFPLLAMLQWIWAIALEVSGARKKW